MKISSPFNWLPIMALSIFLGQTLQAAEDTERRAELIKAITAANEKLDPAQLATKWKKMKKSPFAFYRATDHLFFHDLAHNVITVPQDWKAQDDKVSTWISADCHFQNAGFIDIGNGELLFAPNDFDESDRGPFYWDLLRCVTSIYLVADKDEVVDSSERLSFEFKTHDRDEFTAKFLKTYFDAVKEGSPAPLDESRIREISGKKGWLSGKLDEWKSSAQLEEFWNDQTGGKRDAFATNIPAKLRPLPQEQADELTGGWTNYQKTTANFAGAGPDYYAIKAKAERLGSGLGSLGVKKIYVLIDALAATSQDNVLLECKECPTSAMAGQVPPRSQAPAYKSEAERVSMAMHKMLSQVEGHEGWFVAKDRSYHVTKMSPSGNSFKLADFESKDDLWEFLKFTALALAAAHCHADPAFAENARQFLREQVEVKTTIADLGKDYAEQVMEDYEIFLDAAVFGKSSN